MSRFQDVKDPSEQFETTTSGSEKEIDHQQKLQDLVSEPESKLRGAVRPADVQQLVVVKEEVPPEDCSPSLDQEDPPEPPHIKEEQEELWTGQEGEQLRGLEEADITKFTFSRVSVKSEEEEEEKAQSSQLHQNQAEQMETRGPEPARNSDPDTHLEPETEDSSETENSSETETDDGDTNWRDADRKALGCSVCGKTFKHRGNLNVHMMTHTGVKPFSCSVCGKRFTQKAGLDYHLRTHTGERPFSCSVCGKTFRHKGALTYHTATHTGLKAFGCSNCGRRFRGTSQLKIHKCFNESSQLHKSQSEKCKKPLSCSECDATFPNNYLLMTHMRMHKGKKLFTCTVCGQKRQFSSHLEIHMRTHTGEKPYSCSVCGKRFSQRGIMTQHMAVHSGVKPFGCSVCGKRFFWQFQVKKHKCVGESSQRRRAGFNGEDCEGPEPARNSDPDKKTKPSFEPDDSVDIEFWKETRQHLSGFTYRRDKKLSVKTEPNTEERVGSDSCKQTGPHQSGLNHLKNDGVSVGGTGSNDSHTLQTHKKCATGEKPFSCLFCGKGFVTGGYLTRHISVHTGEKPLRCIICEKRFRLESDLLSHQCGKGFGREPQLQEQMRTHTGGKPFSCSVCNSGFRDSESLVKHMRIHTGQTQFSCSICGKEFAWRRYLTKHMEVHAKEKLYSCSVCDRRFTQIYQLNYHQCAGPRSSQLHQNQTEQMETGGPEPTRNSDPDTHLEPDTEDKTEDSSETEDNDEDWTETREPQSRLNSVKHDEVSDPTCDADRKRLSCSICEEQFKARGGLSRHMAVHTGAHRGAKQEDPEPPHIIEEQEELWTGQEGEQLRGLEEADITFSRVPVKSEEDDEEKPQSSQLHQNQTEQMETQGPEPARNSDPDTHLEADGDEKTLVSFKTEDSVDSDFWKETVERPSGWDSGRNTVSCSDEKESESVEPESEDSADSDFWKDNSKPQLHLNSLKKDVSGSDMRPNALRYPYSCSECGRRFAHICNLQNHMKFHTGEKAFFCSVCGQKCLYRSHLKIHMRTHTGEKPFICPVCGKKYAHKASMQSHMSVHVVDKRHTCDVCDRSFAWYTELKYHQCVAEASQGAAH